MGTDQICAYLFEHNLLSIQLTNNMLLFKLILNSFKILYNTFFMINNSIN